MEFLNKRRMAAGVLSLACAVFGVFAACAPGHALAQPAGLPSMGAASSYALSPALETLLGDAIMAQGRRDPSYIDDPDVTQYLMSMGSALAVHAPERTQRIRVFGVRDAQINAFALPGGYVGINSGLVVQAQSESELASVVAHEIGHVVQRHIARGMTQQAQNSNLMMASIVGALLAALAGSGDLAMGVAAFGQAAAIDQQLGFSRHAEREADRVGFDMLTRAGYDPQGMVRMFNQLMGAARFNQTAMGLYHSTHPSSIERLSDIENRLARTPPVDYRDSDDFWYVRAKLRVLQARDTRAQRNAVQTLQQAAQQESGVPQAAAWYGLAVAALNRSDILQAAHAWQQAVQIQAESPYLAQLNVRVIQHQQGLHQAVQAAEAAWQRWPNRMGLAMLRVQLLQQANQHAQAIAFLQDCIQHWPDEPRLHELQAHSFEQNADPIAARRAMANYYEKIGALVSAVNQLRQARALTQDFYVQSELDTRIRALRQRLDTERALLRQFQ